MSAYRTIAEQACIAMMGRINNDPRIAYLVGPGSETYDLLTAAVAKLRDEAPASYRAQIEAGMRTEAVIGRSQYDALEQSYDELLTSFRNQIGAEAA